MRGLARGSGAHRRRHCEQAVPRHVLGELAHVVGLRVLDQLGGGAGLLDDAVLHDDDPVGKPDGLIEVMRDEKDRLLQHVLQAQELVLHLAADERVEGGEGLVEEPELGPHRERAGNPHALLLPAGELARVVALAPFEADELDHLAGTSLARAPVDALDLERKGDVLQHRAVGQQREVLETPCPSCGGGAASAPGWSP